MTDIDDLDDIGLRLRAYLNARADGTVVDGQLEAIAARTRRSSQRPAWLEAVRGLPGTFGTVVGRPAPLTARATWAVVLVSLLAVLLLVAVAVGTRPAPPTGPLNGLIVFVQVDRPGGPGIVHVVRPDGSGDHVVRPEPHDRAFWSPDGKRLGWNDGYANADGTDDHQADLTFGTLLVSCWDWSPDGASCLAGGGDVSLPRRSGVYLLSALERADPVQITRVIPPTPHRDVPGAFAPDGRRVAFVRVPAHETTGTLMLVNVDGTGERQVTSAPVAQGVSWAPDGRSILAASAGRLVRIDVATGAVTPVSMGSLTGADVLEGRFSPDGSRILVRRREPNGAADLYAMDANGDNVIRLTATAADETSPDWGTHPIDE